MRSALAALVAAVALLGVAGCGDPDVALTIPPRQPGQQVLDTAGILDDAVTDRLAALSEETGLDIVAVTFTDPAASLGQADRGGRALLDGWGADVVLVAVARPGDFASGSEDRRRFFGVFSTDRFAVGRGLREEIVERAVPPAARANQWTEAFLAAADALAAGVAGAGG
jgi:uncharacterized membrane protein YgcG